MTLAALSKKELNRLSPEFYQWWPRHDVRSHGEGIKSIQHPSRAYDARIHSIYRDLSMIVYTPALGTGTAEKMTKLLGR